MSEDNSNEQQFLGTSPFNYVSSPLDFNACVGTNGGYNQLTIYDGFMEAVGALFVSVEKMENPSDTFVYPILLCFRHSIELFLKELNSDLYNIDCVRNHQKEYRDLLSAIKVRERIIEQSRLSDRKAIGTEDSLSLASIDEKIAFLTANIYHNSKTAKYNHNLDSILKSIYSINFLDSRIKVLLDNVLPVLEHYRYIDPDGDAFRYWSDIDGKPHFSSRKIRIVALPILHRHYIHVKEQFLQIMDCMSYLSREYLTGTVTPELSRSQIKDIAKLIPKPHEFADKIKDAKVEIMKEYGLSAHKFDKILQIIRGHREFSMLMGNEIVFHSLSDSTIESFVRSALNIDEWEECANNISYDEVALLLTFYEMSGHLYGCDSAYFSEDLDSLFSDISDRFKYRDSCYIINPVTSLKHVIMGMERCGQATYVSRVNQFINRYTKTE